MIERFNKVSQWLEAMPRDDRGYKVLRYVVASWRERGRNPREYWIIRDYTTEDELDSDKEAAFPGIWLRAVEVAEIDPEVMREYEELCEARKEAKENT